MAAPSLGFWTGNASDQDVPALLDHRVREGRIWDPHHR